MSHRTQDLEPLSGLPHFIRELRYHEVSRQTLAGVLILLFTLTARPIPALVWAGTVLIVIGTVLRFFASGFILKNKELAATGPYALVRHPLYTGNILIIIGFAIASSTWWSLPLAIAFFWFYYPPAIEYEDRKLERLFGDTWRQWSSKVPALVPAFSGLANLGGGSWSFAKSLRQNGELFIAGYVLVCLYFIARQVI